LVNERPPNKQGLISSALTISRLSTGARGLLTGLLLIEISQTFDTTIAETNQMNTANALIAIITAIAMGIISLRYNHKTLLISGLILSMISTLGCSYAPSFFTLVIIYSLGGLAASIIFPMTTALLGEYVEQENRSKVLGLMMAGGAALYTVGYPIVNYIGDWRNAFLYFVLPLVVVSLVLCIWGLPASVSKSENVDMLAGYRGIFSSRSAVASLVGYSLGMGVWSLTLSLGSSFYRDELVLSRDMVSNITILLSLAYIVGAMATSRLINRWRQIRVVYGSLFVLGVGTCIRFFISDLILNFVLGFIVVFMAGVMSTSCQGLNLEQLPDLRGPMMSMTNAFSSIGTTLSLSLSGFLLTNFGWGVMGAMIGVFGILAGFLVYFLVRK
jgi:predicted MFS family arabinose efflux permease